MIWSALLAVAAYAAHINEAALVVTQGTPRLYGQTTGTTSGRTIRRYFCGECGSPLWDVSEAKPGEAYVRPALFGVAPGIAKEIFWENAHGESTIFRICGGRVRFTMVTFDRRMGEEIGARREGV